MNPFAQIVEYFAHQVYIEPTTGGYFNPGQPPGEPIVPSTKKTWSAGRGYAIQNCGTSQAPVAIRLVGRVGSSPLILRPGDAVYPGEFDAFEYGLPFGWAGGGTVMLKVGLTPAVKFEQPVARPEIIYWRVILKIEADADPLPALKRNWPSRFPWEYAKGSALGADQSGTPSLFVEPTRTLLYLPDAGVNAGLAAAGTYGARLHFRTDTTSDEMGQGDYSADVTWTTGAGGAIWPGVIAELDAKYDRIDLNQGGVTITSPDATLAVGDWIVAVRYGRL